jgi:hypothetical protein
MINYIEQVQAELQKEKVKKSHSTE